MALQASLFDCGDSAELPDDGQIIGRSARNADALLVTTSAIA
jgi:hypothetical protein